MGRYLDMARKFEARRQASVSDLMESPRSASVVVPSRRSPTTIYQELADATPSAEALNVFPDWTGLLVKSSVLGMSVWVVRSRDEGLVLAKETGHPALLLDDVLRMKGWTQDEAREALLSKFITAWQ